MIDQHIKDTIENALLVGMDLKDAALLCSLTPSQIEEIEEECKEMLSRSRATREYNLLCDLNSVIQTQKEKGNDHALIWALSKTNQKYADKDVENVNEVHFHIPTHSVSKAHVEVNEGSASIYTDEEE